MNMKHLLLFCWLSSICINFAQGNINESGVEISIEDSSWNVVGIQIGYFPTINDESFVSPGFSALFFIENESLESRFSAGWYINYRRAFFQEEYANMRINESVTLVRDFVIFQAYRSKEKRLKLKFGLGFTMPFPAILSYVGITANFAVLYSHRFNKYSELGISISIDNCGDRILPPVISLNYTF